MVVNRICLLTGMGSANFMEMQQRMQRDLLNNPDMLRQVLDNPLTQSLMSNPEIIRQMLESNPQMQVLYCPFQNKTKYFKNKTFLASLVFSVFFLFLDLSLSWPCAAWSSGGDGPQPRDPPDAQQPGRAEADDGDREESG